MKGKRSVLGFLNKVLANELMAIHQYFLHSRMLKNWGFGKLAEHEYGESVDEMKHADRLVERLLLLEGVPDMHLGKIAVGTDVPSILQYDLQLENKAMPALREGIVCCEKNSDFVSRNLLREILDSEEEHVDWLETQLELIEKTGLENYLQSSI